MKRSFYFLAIFTLISQTLFSQVVLEANGSGNTYELINSVLANPNRNVVEVPDCNHADFGNHIDEVFDTDLNKYVFRFHIHVTPDNDRCKTFDRQRNEIKTYADSPENLKANIGETIEYKWKFKISENFKPSSNFTHIHQIKSVEGSYASIPIISLTLRKSSPDRLELRYTPTNNQNTLKTANLDLFRGNWVEVYEKITFGNSGSYTIEIKNILSDELLFNYTDNDLDLWQDGAEFARPKWGIYRSLNNQQDLQDEIVKYADFSIEEITGALSIDDLKQKAERILLFPNPSSHQVTFQNANSDNYDAVEFYDNSGRKISIKNRLKENKLDVSQFSKGLYFIVFKKDTVTTKVLKCYIK
jgi:hypothetical protein